MNKILSSLIFCGFTLAASAQDADLGVGYNLQLAQGQMKNGFTSSHGLTLDVLLPIKKMPMLSVGADLGYGIYGMRSQTQEYRFGNTTTITDVNLTSQIFSAGGKLRINPLYKSKVQPYAAVQFGGLNMYSSLYVEDPNDPDGCKALEQRKLVKDWTWYTGLGGGVRFQVKQKHCGKSFVDIGVNYMMGGNVEYANMNRIHNHTAPATGPTPDSKPLMVKFINVTTNETHEHEIAEVYTHPLRMLQAQVKYVITF